MLPDERSVDRRAISPVIGIVLMVAVTVILAGVAGVFLFNAGEVDAVPAPQAQFAVEFDESATDVGADGCDDGSFDSANGELEIKHNGGEAIDVDNLSIRGAQPTDAAFADCSSLSAGSRVTVQDAAHVEAADDDVVRLVWTADNGDSYVLEKWNGSAA